MRIGNQFYKDEKPVLNIEDFDNVKMLITEAQSRLRTGEHKWDKINVIFRKYEVGGELVPHVDRPQFSETVWTCVLKTCTSASRWIKKLRNKKSSP